MPVRPGEPAGLLPLVRPVHQKRRALIVSADGLYGFPPSQGHRGTPRPTGASRRQPRHPRMPHEACWSSRPSTSRWRVSRFFKAPCASGWSLTDVLSSARTSTVTAIIRSFCNAMNTRSNTPAFARRLAFLYTLFQLPYSAGSALHLHPFPATYNSARTNVKLSVFTFPRCTVRHPLILSNCSIVSVMNPTLAHSPISVNTPWFCCLFNGDTLSRYAQTTMLTQRPVLLAFLSSLPSRLLRVTWHDSFQRK